MNRDIYKILMQWKAESNRRPLLIRGARQVGKTYLVRYFGKEEFEDYIELNFEKNPEYKDIFTSIDPIEIVEKITLFTQLKVNVGKTLLFLDEIQDCPAAIASLRYFFEEMPELHIIAAGSLIEFTINAENFRMPVGRVQCESEQCRESGRDPTNQKHPDCEKHKRVLFARRPALVVRPDHPQHVTQSIPRSR